jgi:hypothetical protein
MTQSTVLKMCLLLLLPGMTYADKRFPVRHPVVSEFKVSIPSTPIILTAPPNYTVPVTMKGGMEIGLAAFPPTLPGDPMRVQVNAEANHVTATGGTLKFSATGKVLNVVSLPLVNNALTVDGRLWLRVRGAIDPGPPGIHGAIDPGPPGINPVQVRYSVTVNSSGKVTAYSVQLLDIANN